MIDADIKKLSEIAKVGASNWLRIRCKDGTEFEGYPDCWTYVSIGDDEDVEAISFTLRKGIGRDIAGAEIESFEVLEAKARD